MKFLWFFLLLLVLVAAEFLKVYFIMPFPGSQEDETLKIAYFLHKYIWFIRIPAWALVVYLFIDFITKGKMWARVTGGALLLVYGAIFFLFNFKFLADKIFVQPTHKILATIEQNKVPETKLVMGVVINGIARAYPIEIMGYHHQVRDTINGESIMVTYCTVCRTGRVYSPVVDGKPENFRLVGMDHFNAMFEDETTHSWWRQVNGEAVAGPMKGHTLAEIPYIQTTLASWAKMHPQTLVLQPDADFVKKYEGLEGYDNGTLKGSLEGTDSASWQRKSWVVGVVVGKTAKAYDWNTLKKQKTINDTISEIPVLLAIEPDGQSFHVWQRNSIDNVFTFKYSDSLKMLVDDQTHSLWNFSGECIEGEEKGNELRRIQAYQEFWHSWQEFRPNTLQYGK